MIRVETLPQLFDTALLLAYQPLPAGPPGRRGRATPRRWACWSPTRCSTRGWSRPATRWTSGVAADARSSSRAAVRRGACTAPTAPDAPGRGVRPAGRDARARRTPGRCARRSRARASRWSRCSSPSRACPAELAVPGPDGAPGARVGAQLPQPGAGRVGAGAGRAVRARGAQTPVGEFVVPDGVDPERGPRAGGPARAPSASACSATTRPSTLLGCYGIELAAVPAGRRRRRGRGRGRGARLPGGAQGGRGSAGGTAPTSSACGSTS